MALEQGYLSISEASKGDADTQRPPGRAPKRVLVVDSDRQGRVLIAQMLAGLGFRVALADDAAEALRSMSSGSRFHAALAAAELPDMGGTELVTGLREIVPGLRVILTGGKAEGAAADYFETLPEQFTSAELSKMLGPAY